MTNKFKKQPDMKFCPSEIAILWDTFQCKNSDDLRNAMLKVESLTLRYADETFHPADGDCHLKLVLLLANELYEDFQNPNICSFERRKKPGTPGRKKELDIPYYTNALILELISKGEAKTRREAIKILKRRGILPNLSTKYLGDAISAMETARNEAANRAKKVFSEYLPEKFETLPEIK